MRTIKVILFGYFGLLSMIFLTVLVGEIVQSFHGENALGQTLGTLAKYIVPVVLACIFGMASWAAWLEGVKNGKPKRILTITASLLSLLLSVGIPLLYFRREGAGAFWYLQRVFGLPTLIGIISLFVFARARSNIVEQSR